jgi:hypothetical protein
VEKLAEGQNHRLASSLVRVKEDTSSNPLCGPSTSSTQSESRLPVGHLLLSVTHTSVSPVCKSRSDPHTCESTVRFYVNCWTQLLPTYHSISKLEYSRVACPLPEYWSRIPCMIRVMTIRRVQVLHVLYMHELYKKLEMTMARSSAAPAWPVRPSITNAWTSFSRPSPPAMVSKMPMRIDPLACGDLRPGMLALNNLGSRLGRSSLLRKFIS